MSSLLSSLAIDSGVSSEKVFALTSARHSTMRNSIIPGMGWMEEKEGLRRDRTDEKCELGEREIIIE